MFVDLLPYYASPDQDSHYNHKQAVSIPSVGTFYGGLRVPDLLLTVLFRIDPKTGNLVHDVKLMFQSDGPSNCQLNFKHTYVNGDYREKNKYKFDVNMDVLFGEGATRTRTIKGGANLGVDAKVIKGGVDGSYESGLSQPDTQTTLRGRIEGTLDAKASHNRLHAHAYMYGSALQHLDR